MGVVVEDHSKFFPLAVGGSWELPGVDGNCSVDCWGESCHANS